MKKIIFLTVILVFCLTNNLFASQKRSTSYSPPKPKSKRKVHSSSPKKSIYKRKDGFFSNYGNDGQKEVTSEREREIRDAKLDAQKEKRKKERQMKKLREANARKAKKAKIAAERAKRKAKAQKAAKSKRTNKKVTPKKERKRISVPSKGAYKGKGS